MGNTLNTDLTGRTVVLSTKCLRPEYHALRERLFHVVGGFGASPGSRGGALLGTFLCDGQDGRMRGEDVERIATAEDYAEAGVLTFQCPSCGVVQPVGQTLSPCAICGG